MPGLKVEPWHTLVHQPASSTALHCTPLHSTGMKGSIVMVCTKLTLSPKQKQKSEMHFPLVSRHVAGSPSPSHDSQPSPFAFDTVPHPSLPLLSHSPPVRPLHIRGSQSQGQGSPLWPEQTPGPPSEPTVQARKEGSPSLQPLVPRWWRRWSEG